VGKRNQEGKNHGDLEEQWDRIRVEEINDRSWKRGYLLVEILRWYCYFEARGFNGRCTIVGQMLTLSLEG